MKVPAAARESFNSTRPSKGRVPVKLVEHLEGRTRLVVPALSLAFDPPPTSPVFFNPAAALNRDISVCVTDATAGTSFCDSMAGVGARGIRVANEVGRIDQVALVDFNRQALLIARKAAELNGVLRKCEFAQSETSSYLYSRYGRNRRFDFVDVDPFGTPVGQLQGAIRATSDGGILSVTATDTAVLCGVYPKVARRRYGAIPLNNHFNHETAIRLLAGAVARTAASLDTGARPVVAHSTRHYVRLFFSIETGATRGDSALRNIGYVSWCPSCGHVKASAEPEASCERCGKKARPAGPVWVGPLTDIDVLRRAKRAAEESGLQRAAETFAALLGVDRFPPWSFSIAYTCSKLGVATASESEVYRNLKESGYDAMRTPFERSGIKTDANYEAFTGSVENSLKSTRARKGPPVG
jgi:tRNA (guanine26-N2/guanine27-N2)-dimethyltransferase